LSLDIRYRRSHVAYKNLMETIRLRGLQKPSHCEQLVDACVRARLMVPASAVRTPLSELSIPLRVLAKRSSSLGDSSSAWLAWSEGASMWFVAGTTSLEMSRERGRPVLQLRVYDQEGALDEAVTCVQTAANTWERCA
jgi:hypothetical protein